MMMMKTMITMICSVDDDYDNLDAGTNFSPPSQQMDFLRAGLRLLESQTGPRGWWVGGSDIGREGGWFWQPSLRSVGDFVWSSQDGFNFDKNCLALKWVYDYAGMDFECEDFFYPICYLGPL